MLGAGFPITAGASSVNRFCSSGLKAVQDIANQISMGSIDIGVAMGAESMTAGGDRLEAPFHEEITKNQDAMDCMQPMGQTSENVGNDFNISREQQDRYSAESFRRAEVAQKAGWFDDEIVPITTILKDPKTGEEKEVTLTRDEGPRYGTTYEGLAKIRPAFPQFGDKSTGGNSSQVTDGGKTNEPSTLQSLTFPSCRHPLDEAVQGHRTRPAHRCQVLRRDYRRRRSPNHGNWPIGRNPQAPL